MDQQLIREFMDEHVIPFRAKLDDFLPVILGARKAGQMIMPAELPDSGILGTTIDERFRQKMAGERLPGETLTNFLKFKAARLRRKNKRRDLRFQLQALRDIYADIVEGSTSYKVYMDWIGRLGLHRKELESRPTIREIYIFGDESVAVELEGLQDLRKDIRYSSMRNPDPSAAGTLRVFPEEHHPAFLRKAGTILGFPACCIDRYVFDRGSGVLSPEVRASNQILHSEAPDDIDRFAYFTKDFFPCQPDCPEAAKIGRAIYEALRTVDEGLSDDYLKHLEGNVALVKQYPEIIQQRIANLQREASPREVGSVEK